jgi:hypothetical protein
MTLSTPKKSMAHDALRLGSQELRPGRTLTSRSGWKAVTGHFVVVLRARGDPVTPLDPGGTADAAPCPFCGHPGIVGQYVAGQYVQVRS